MVTLKLLLFLLMHLSKFVELMQLVAAALGLEQVAKASLAAYGVRFVLSNTGTSRRQGTFRPWYS